ncbi:MAG: alkaline phosphatase family protein [Bacteroidales bacterium]|nr:alkaline phosphatase family protein [Bacteroidales bacterium]
MKKLVKSALISVLAVTLAACCKSNDNYTVVISLDGFRWDYPDMYDMPFMDSLASIGVKARMEPSFPSSTFPNHYTLVTGLVPDHHGLVNNSFWNPDTNHGYSLGDPESRYSPDYYGGEPIWATAQRQGVKAGVVYWVGSDIAIGGVYPTYYRNWDEDPHWTFEERVDELVRLLSLPEKERPHLVMGYFDEPDHQGHVFGPYAPETKAMCAHMDSLMHSFYKRIMALPIADRINLVITGDHGMTEISPERFIPLQETFPEEWAVRISGNNPTSIWAAPGCADSLYNRLSKIEHISVWRHGEVPERLCYGTSNRLGDIIVSPDLGWQFNFKPSHNNGTHGFNCTETDMLVAFRAAGPDFKVGYEAPLTEGEPSAFRNIDIYPMICKLLGIKPAPVDGKLERIRKILK